MASSIDDKDFDDPNLWAAIDSAAAASFSTPTTTTSPSAATAVADKSLTSPITKFPKLQSSPQINQHNHRFSTPQPSIIRKPSVEAPRSLSARIPVKDSVALRPAAKIRDHVDHQLPRKVSRIACVSEVREITPLTSTVAANHAHESACEVTVREVSSFEENTMQIQCWTGGKENEATGPVVGTAIARFPSVSGFKDYQDTAMEILEKSDYIMISGNPYIKKSGWRKLAFYFNVSFEIKDKNIEFDDSHNVQRAEFVVRAYMQGGRFCDGWGSCECREKRFMKPNNDIPSTAETRAKNKACQDLLGIGQYRPGRPR